MESKFMKVLGLISLGAAGLLVSAGALISPSFVASYVSSTNISTEGIIEAIQVLRILAVFIGVLAAVFGGINLMYPSRMNRLFDLISRLEGRFQPKYFDLTFCFACFRVAFTLGLTKPISKGSASSVTKAGSPREKR